MIDKYFIYKLKNSNISFMETVKLKNIIYTYMIKIKYKSNIYNIEFFNGSVDGREVITHC